ncbi:ATPase domain-containing protein [Halonotius sp. GCM10025705]|uniref:ATPase domain-containing protein n=1 Tax=Halonotius sp. GCM10025705 TaxID=3252678 RepID=UPI0036211557
MVVTPQLQHIYSLGLAGRDQVNRAFGGGLPTGSLVAVEGRHGSGKSTLAGRFAYGLCEQSHTVTYLSTEREFGRFLSQMRSLSYTVQKSLLRRDLLYLYGDLNGSTKDDQPELLSRLQAAQRLWTSDVVIFDTFSDILLYDPTVASLAAKGATVGLSSGSSHFFGGSWRRAPRSCCCSHQVGCRKKRWNHSVR